ncbi:MAG: sigma-70 family RNA polymerase sigma factor [Lachnospiraceae bacterium]|nr:sigma-70 family RNA polymerase sigma factor [Lachnospiraceae bacterium]
MKTSQELQDAVRKYQDGDKEIFDRIYELSYPYLHACVMHAVKDEELSMDMLQETYMEISKNISQLKNVDDFLHWAARIANRKCYAYMNKKKDLFISGQEEADYFEQIADDEAFIPEEILQDKEKQRLIKEIIDNLSDMQRLCIIGYYFNELKQEEIAQELGIPVNTVKTHLNRAKAKIKEAVVELDEKKGTRLYALAPFLLLFLDLEAEACQTIPMMSQNPLETQTSDSISADNTRADNTPSGKPLPTGKGFNPKLILGTVALTGVIGIGIFFAMNGDNGGQSEEILTVENPETTSLDTSDTLTSSLTEATTDSTTNSGAESATENETDNTTTTTTESSTDNITPLAISGLYDEYSDANEGVIAVCKDNKWGLVTYDNEVLVPLEYEYCSIAANDDGLSFFGNPGDYHVFDNQGKEIFQTTETITAVSEGIILTEREDTGDYIYDFAYYTTDGKLLYRPESDPEYPLDDDLYNAVGFSDGYAFFGDGHDMRISKNSELFDLFDVTYAEEIADTEANNAASTTESATFATINAYPIGATSQGYYVAKCSGDYPYDCYAYLLHSADGTKSYRLAMSSVFNKEGSYQVTDSNSSWTLSGYYKNGVYRYNYDTLMAAYISNGDFSTCYLLDVSKLEQQDNNAIQQEFDGVESTNDEEILNFDWSHITDEAVIIQADAIQISDEKYWLISQEGKWGYIDHTGNILHMYQDATTFHEGKAIVIENDTAYWIDETFTKTTEICPAKSVFNLGDVFLIIKPDDSNIMVSN